MPLGKIWDHTNITIENLALDKEKKTLEFKKAKTKKELNELQNVIVNFLEYSEIYRKKVKNYLRLNEDYLCIMKSSEGLSDVYKEMEKKEMLPFTKVLSSIPGSIRPFERMCLFLIPIRSLKGLNRNNVKLYINKKIIPLVEKERKEFLGKLPTEIAEKADEFSYKYLAFLLRKYLLNYDYKNRKFNHKFIEFVVREQPRPNIKKMTSSLGDIIRTKEFLSLVEWPSFVKLNLEQKKLVEKRRTKINSELEKNGINNLPELSKCNLEDLFSIFKKIFRADITELKIKNLVQKVIDGSRNTLDILRKNGIRI